jgi:hypothetical protein
MAGSRATGMAGLDKARDPNAKIQRRAATHDPPPSQGGNHSSVQPESSGVQFPVRCSSRLAHAAVDNSYGKVSSFARLWTEGNECVTLAGTLAEATALMRRLGNPARP